MFFWLPVWSIQTADGERLAWGSETAIAASLAMEATPEAQPEILRIRDDIIMQDLPATPVPKPPAARQRPAATATKKRKTKSTTDTAEEKAAAKSAKTAAAIAARAVAVVELAIDSTPGRFWPRFAEYRSEIVRDGLSAPELPATHGKWKRIMGKVKARVREIERARQVRYIVRHCNDKGYIAISIVEACLT